MDARLIPLTTLLIAFAALAGCGRHGSAAADNGAPSDVYPATHASLPQLVNGGEVASAPTLVAVTYANDPNRAAIDDFVAKIGASSYWAATVAEYGVGVPQTAVVHLADNAPSTVQDAQIEPSLLSNLDGTHPEWPANSAGTVYLFFYPQGTSITGPDGTSCVDYGAYHYWTTGNANGHSAAYAVIPTCGAEPGFDVFQSLTIGASHEIVEAMTDPYGNGYYQTKADGIWDLLNFGGEVGDMCQMVDGYGVTPSDLGYTVQRSWSNAAAAAGKDPCQPYEGVYWNAAPVLDDVAQLTYQGFTQPTKAVKIPVGQAKTVELDLFSSAATSGPITVDPVDVATWFGSAPELKLSLDRTQGLNGEKLHLRIQVLKAGATLPGGGEGVLVYAKTGSTQNYWPIFVSN